MSSLYICISVCVHGKDAGMYMCIWLPDANLYWLSSGAVHHYLLSLGLLWKTEAHRYARLASQGVTKIFLSLDSISKRSYAQILSLTFKVSLRDHIPAIELLSGVLKPTSHLLLC